MKEKLKYIINWCSWQPEHKTQFVKNMCWGIAIAIILQFSYNTGIGQDMINIAHDFLVEADYRQNVLKGTGQNMISNDLRMIVFDKETYETNDFPGKCYWTPREFLGKTIIRSIEMGATVVAIDFSLEKPVPFTCMNGKCVDENSIYLTLLQQAAEMARKNNSVIIIPQISHKQNENIYAKAYRSLIEKNSDVLIQGIPKIYCNSNDLMVRHFNFFFQPSKKHEPIISVPVLATVHHWYNNNKEKADTIIQQLTSEIKDNKKITPVNSPSNQEQNIQLFYQQSNKECLAARYKYRILPEQIIHNRFGGGNKPSIVINPSILLDKYIDRQRIQDKIVIIGADYSNFGDVHRTPVGNIAGVYLIANAMNMLLMSDQIKEFHFVFKFSILLVWIIIASLLYTHLPKNWSFPILILLLLSINTPVSVWLFSKWGVFMDFWLPISIMGIVEFMEPTISSLHINILKRGNKE
jgi:hypothetical protein